MTAQNAPAKMRKLALAAGLALSFVIGTGAASPAASNPSLGGGTARFVDRGGPVLSAAQVYLIYWGRAWIPGMSASPTSDEITTAIQTVVAGSYLSGLAQYRNIGSAVIRGSLVVTTSEPPSVFTNKDVAAFLNAQFDAGSLPAPTNQTLYFVTIPPGLRSGEGEFVAEHYYYKRDGQRIRYAWTAGALSLDYATWAMTHELVESVTDPEGDAVLGVTGTCEQHGWCEIADICPSTGVLDGVTVSSYWSTIAGDCVIPAPPSLGPSDRYGPEVAASETYSYPRHARARL